MSELRRTIQELIREEIPVVVKRGRVNSINFTTDTIEVSPVEGATFFDVKLRSITNESVATNRMVTYPKVGSSVLIGCVNNDGNDAFVLAVSEIDSIRIQMPTGLDIHVKNTQEVEITSPRVKFNGGLLGGMVKVNDQVTRMNLIESKINALIAVINSWTPVAGDGGAALKTLITAWAASTLTSTTATMLQNPKVLQ